MNCNLSLVKLDIPNLFNLDNYTASLEFDLLKNTEFFKYLIDNDAATFPSPYVEDKYSTQTIIIRVYNNKDTYIKEKTNGEQPNGYFISKCEKK